MKRMMFQADEAVLERARRRAAEQGVSVAQVIREALEKELGLEPTVPHPTRLIGIVHSENGDLSQRASEDEFEPEPYR